MTRACSYVLKYFIMVSFTGVMGQISPIHIPDDAKLNFSQLANKYVPKTEEYDIMSVDGYILKLFRIPGDIRRPLLCIHGAIDSADSFIIRGNTSLAVALAKDNYDVWAMNFRGNTYSRRHTKLDPDSDKAFWDFSFHEIAYYDVPAVIDFILNETGERMLSIIGYSEGTTTMYVLGATRPEYNDKVKIFISLAPICYLHNADVYLSLFIQSANLINTGLEALQCDELGGPNSITRAFIEHLCYKDEGYRICMENGLFLLTGSDVDEIEPEFFPIIVGHFPTGTSRKNFNHLSQIGRSRKFVNYDYGIAQNLIRYGKMTPPPYDLSKVTMKIALIVAKNDKISTIKDVAILRKRLPNVVEYKVMKNKAFNHVDYVWGRNTYKTLYPDILQILNKYK